MSSKPNYDSIRMLSRIQGKLLKKLAIREKAAKVMSPLPPLHFLPKLRYSNFFNLSPRISPKLQLKKSITPEPELLLNKPKTLGMLIALPKYLSYRPQVNSQLTKLHP